MSQTKVCWNCRAAVILSALECPVCFAGLDPEARGLSPERAADEQQGLIAVPHSPAPPRDGLGCLALVGLVLAGIVTAAFVAATIGFTAHSQPCTGSPSDCGEYVGITTGISAFVIAVPLCSFLYIWLANRSLAKARKSYEINASNRSSD